MGGGGGGETTSTVTQSNIPDYLQPQVEALLGGATQQLFNTDGGNNITGIKPFVAYGSNIARGADGQPIMQNGQFQYMDANGRPISANEGAFNAAKSAVADFTPLQRQTQANVGAMTNPYQFDQALGLTAQQSGNSFTDPETAKAFMNPYLEQSLLPQAQILAQQQGMQHTANNAQAVQAGAFGGSRMGVQKAQQNQADQLAMSNLVGQGYNNAYNLGMNQYNTEQANQLAAADQLSGIAGASEANRREMLNMQNTAGGQQQQQNQNIVNQAVSNYAMQQQYPTQQLNEYSSLLRGYAIPGQTQTTYQAPPSTTSMLAGLGTAAVGANNLMNKAKGGIIRSNGGISKLALYNATRKKG